MKNILIALFIFIVSTCYGKENGTSIKFYPFAFTSGKFYYCSDLKFGLEQRIKDRSRLELGGHFSFPNFISLAGGFISSLLFATRDLELMYGCGGFLSYKYNLNKKNLFVGAKITSVFYKTIGNTSVSYSNNDDNSTSSSSGPYKINLYMNSANFMFGWSGSKTRTGIELAVEIGYRYNRGYYLIRNRTIEMPVAIGRKKTLYDYLRFPLRIGLDASINLCKFFKKRN